MLDRRDGIMRQCEAFLDDYDAWLMPVMPDAAFIRQKQSEPLMIDGTPHPYFFAGTAYNFLANLTGQPSIVLPCGFSKEGAADRPAAHRQALGRRTPARRRQGAGEAPAALSRAAELQDAEHGDHSAAKSSTVRRGVWRRMTAVTSQQA